MKTFNTEYKGKHYQITENDDGDLVGRVRVRGKNGYHMQNMPAGSLTVAEAYQLAVGGRGVVVEESEADVTSPLPDGVSLDGCGPGDLWWRPTWAKAKEGVPVNRHRVLGLGGVNADLSKAYFKLPGNHPWIVVDIQNT